MTDEELLVIQDAQVAANLELLAIQDVNVAADAALAAQEAGL
jgi:hypothetical protein